MRPLRPPPWRIRRPRSAARWDRTIPSSSCRPICRMSRTRRSERRPSRPLRRNLRPPKPQADRRALDAAEAALRQLEDGRKRGEDDLHRRQDELDAAKRAAQAAYNEDRKAATDAIAVARRACLAAGGRD